MTGKRTIGGPRRTGGHTPRSGFAAALLAMTLAAGCIEKDGGTVVTLAVRETKLEAGGGQKFIGVASDGEWTVSLCYGSGQEEGWADLDVRSGKGDADLVFTYAPNPLPAERTVRLMARTLKGGRAELALTQAGKPSVTPPRMDAPRWLELPATDEPGLAYFYHTMEYKGGTVRNYSYYYDAENLLSRWVAYPLCAGYMGHSGRTDAWDYDPLLPPEIQPCLYHGFRSDSTGEGFHYDRGHQLPSADRTFSKEANRTTFYFTNMTPQSAKLNQHLWAEIEEKVRTWAKRSDTLYVVTGCTVRGHKRAARDNDGKKVTVPTGYYKAVLRYSRSSTLGVGGYMGAAFYCDHDFLYTGGEHLDKARSLSIAELERRVGTEFFVNLPAAVGKDEAERIKSANPAGESWWW